MGVEREREALCSVLKVRRIFILLKLVKKSYINILPDVIFSARTHFPVEIISEKEIV